MHMSLIRRAKTCEFGFTGFENPRWWDQGKRYGVEDIYMVQCNVLN